ncbi:MAG: pyrophosphatase, partial [Candidatus Neomarinimicrobiota bacterium]
DISLDEIVQMNIDKLKARYPGGEFDAHYSENRKEGDV